MKPTARLRLSIVALFLTVTILKLNALPIPVEIPGLGEDIPKNGTGPGGGKGNSPTDDFFRLQNVVAAFNLANPSTPLPTPLLAGNDPLSSPDVGSGGLTGFDYAVVHYGVGTGGANSSGGGIEVFFLNGASSFDFPANGSGPDGFGGLSGLVLYQGTPTLAPDGGITLRLLALGSGALLLARFFVRRKSWTHLKT